MFEHEPDVAQRRAAPAVEQADASNEAASHVAAPGLQTAASLLHLQRTVGNAAVVQLLAGDGAVDQEQDQPSPVHDVIGKGGGAPLDESTRGSMESQFGQDFGDVRVHTDAKASASAEAVGANAYTVGNDVVFRSGHFDASSPTGQRTIAHELTHVVQQRSGPVDGAEAPGGIRLSDPGDRFERAADHTADQVVSGSSSAPAAASSGTSVQLEAMEESDAEVPIQREMGDEEDDEMSGGPA